MMAIMVVAIISGLLRRPPTVSSQTKLAAAVSAPNVTIRLPAAAAAAAAPTQWLPQARAEQLNSIPRPPLPVATAPPLRLRQHCHRCGSLSEGSKERCCVLAGGGTARRRRRSNNCNLLVQHTKTNTQKTIHNLIQQSTNIQQSTINKYTTMNGMRARLGIGGYCRRLG